MSKFNYGYWRTDKEKEPGFSHELISSDAKFLVERGATLDDLYALPFEGIDTLYKAMQRNIEKFPNLDFLGTRVGDKYEWMTYRDMVNVAESLSHGFIALDLVPTMNAEGKDWRFMGIQSKNRKEWVLTNLANMHQKVTSVALYDTLGPEATRFVCN
jgi:long-subunit acyl-CoA synthetase (AMP-forming)